MVTKDFAPLPSIPQVTLGTPSGLVVVPQPVWLARVKVSSMVLGPVTELLAMEKPAASTSGTDIDGDVGVGVVTAGALVASPSGIDVMRLCTPGSYSRVNRGSAAG